MILYGALVQTRLVHCSQADLFPFCVAITLAIAAVVVGKTQRVPAARAASWKERGQVTVKAIPSLCLPVIILAHLHWSFYPY